MNRYFHPFGGPQVDLNVVFHTALGLEGEVVVVVAAVSGIGQIGLVGVGTDGTLVHVSGRDLSRAVARLGMAVHEASVFEPA